MYVFYISDYYHPFLKDRKDGAYKLTKNIYYLHKEYNDRFSYHETDSYATGPLTTVRFLKVYFKSF